MEHKAAVYSISYERQSKTKRKLKRQQWYIGISLLFTDKEAQICKTLANIIKVNNLPVP